MIPVRMTVEQWQLTVNCLVEIPFKVSAPLIQEIRTQVEGHIQQQAAAQRAVAERMVGAYPDDGYHGPRLAADAGDVLATPPPAA